MPNIQGISPTPYIQHTKQEYKGNSPKSSQKHKTPNPQVKNPEHLYTYNTIGEKKYYWDLITNYSIYS